MSTPMRNLMLGALALPLIAGATAFAQQPPAPQQPPATQAPQPEARRPGPGPQQMTPADRAAMLDARIAAVKAGLRLSPEQDGLWGPLESAVRDGMTKLGDLRERMRTAPPAVDALERMSRQAEASLIRGEAMKRIADTARPLYATLSDEQKRRLPMLMHGPRGNRMAAHGMAGHGMAGRGMDHDHFRDGQQGRMGPRDGDRRGPGMMDRRPDRDMMRRGDGWDDRDGMRRFGPGRDDRDGMGRRGGRDWDEQDEGPRRRWSDRDGYGGRWN